MAFTQVKERNFYDNMKFAQTADNIGPGSYNTNADFSYTKSKTKSKKPPAFMGGIKPGETSPAIGQSYYSGNFIPGPGKYTPEKFNNQFELEILSPKNYDEQYFIVKNGVLTRKTQWLAADKTQKYGKGDKKVTGLLIDKNPGPGTYTPTNLAFQTKLNSTTNKNHSGVLSTVETLAKGQLVELPVSKVKLLGNNPPPKIKGHKRIPSQPSFPSSNVQKNQKYQALWEKNYNNAISITDNEYNKKQEDIKNSTKVGEGNKYLQRPPELYIDKDITSAPGSYDIDLKHTNVSPKQPINWAAQKSERFPTVKKEKKKQSNSAIIDKPYKIESQLEFFEDEAKIKLYLEQQFKKQQQQKNFKTNNSAFGSTLKQNDIQQSTFMSGMHSTKEGKSFQKREFDQYFNQSDNLAIGGAQHKQISIQEMNQLFKKEEKQITPGPGAYLVEKSDFKFKYIPQEKQYFGSTSERFQKDKLLNGKKLDSQVSPFTYNPLDTTIQDLKDETTNEIRRKLAIRTWFDSVQKTKAQKSFIGVGNPGPGEYNHQLENLNKKTFKSPMLSAFNTSTTRDLTQQKGAHIPNPGPGTYGKDKKNKAAKMSHSQFLSKSPNHVPPSTKVDSVFEPSAQDYSLQDFNSTANPIITGGAPNNIFALKRAQDMQVKNQLNPFDKVNPRLMNKSSQSTEHLGPGEYSPKNPNKSFEDHTSSTIPFNISFPGTSKQGTFSKRDRFGEQEKEYQSKSKIPGPGTYIKTSQEEGGGSLEWVKKTYSQRYDHNKQSKSNIIVNNSIVHSTHKDK